MSDYTDSSIVRCVEDRSLMQSPSRWASDQNVKENKMSVQSMQCPKCGTWATEYDEGKWQCLSHRCGIKFLYEKPAPMVNNTFIVGSGMEYKMADGPTFHRVKKEKILPIL